MHLLALLLLSVIPQSLVARDQCTRIERNHFYDEYGKLVFTQYVAWDDCGVFFWRMVRADHPEITLSKEREGWKLAFADGDIHREVYAESFEETWTQADVELVDRENLPVAERRRLKGAR